MPESSSGLHAGAHRRVFAGLAAVALALVAVHVVVPDGLVGELTYMGVTVGAGVVAVVGARRHRGPTRRAWSWVAAGVSLSALADVLFYAYVHIRGFEPDISVADGPWLLSYVAIAVGLFILLRGGTDRDRVDVDGLIDMGVVGVVSLLVVWQVSVQSTLSDTSVPLGVRAVWAAYPILDATLLALLARLATKRRTRSLATGFVAAGVGCWLVSDFCTMLPFFASWTRWLDAGWMAGSALLAAGSWAPTPGAARRAEARPSSVGRWRLALVFVPLLVPGVIEVVSLAQGSEADPVPMLLATVALAALAYARARRLLETRIAAEAELTATEHRFQALVQRSSDAALVLDGDATIRYVSPAAVEQFGYTEADLVGRVGWSLIHPDDVELAVEAFAGLDELGAHGAVDLRILDGRGEWRWVEEVVTNLFDEPAVAGLVANIRDISARKEAEQKLARLALYDDLTGLPNRWQVSDLLDEMLQRGVRVAVLEFDVDQFRLVNSSRGRATGDRLLQAVADRLRGVMPAADTVARLDSNVFAVVCAEVEHWAAVSDRTRVIQDALLPPFEIPGQGRFHLTTSVGMALSARDQKAADLLRQAETAMYAAKERGPGSAVAYDDRLRDEIDDRIAIEHDLRRAVRNGELFVEYQPVVEIATGSTVGVEALVRWRHPERGLIPPSAFIPVAEKSALIETIGAFVLERACRDAVWWDRAGAHLHVAVNVSAAQLGQDRLVELVGATLYDTGLAPGLLVLEVTETALLLGTDRVRANVDALRALGVRISLDDFGTGYSSLAYLKSVPADEIKIDQSFVAGICENPVDRDIVAAVVHLAAALGRTVIAEGVESEEQLAALRRLGCPLGQGFLWAASMPAEAILARVRSTLPRAASV